MQRPEDQERTFLTEEEAAAAEAAASARRAALLEPSEVRAELLRQAVRARSAAAGWGGYNDFWLDYGTNIIEDRRTSLIVDPPDGRLPALTPEGERLRQIGSLAEDLPIDSPGPCPERGNAGPTTPRIAVSPSGACSASTAARR